MAKKKIPTFDVKKMSPGEVAFHFAPLGVGVYVGPQSLANLDAKGHPTDGDLRRPLAFFQAIRLLGSAEDIREDLEAIYRVEEANARLHEELRQLWPAEEREKTASSLERLRDRLRDASKRMAVMENQLEVFGWRFNARTKKVSRIAARKGPDLLAEVAWNIYQEKFKGKGNTLFVRQGIKRILAPYVDADELDTQARTDALIYMAIYNREYRSA